jgi:hypothetical protein
MNHKNLLLFILAAIILFLITSCSDNDCCTDCQIETGDCQCKPDSANHQCPAGFNGWYNYSGDFYYPSCSCICNPGWSGENCDLRDTSYYISFRHGSDTLSLSTVIRTSNYVQFFYPFGYTGYFPPGGTFDSIRFSNLQINQDFAPPYDSMPLCADSACTRLELFLSNGTIASSISGTVALDTFDLFPAQHGGTFEGEFEIAGAGDKYYVQEGKFFLPIILPH